MVCFCWDNGSILFLFLEIAILRVLLAVPGFIKPWVTAGESSAGLTGSGKAVGLRLVGTCGASPIPRTPDAVWNSRVRGS